MATTKEWISGARLRTLPAAIAPVILRALNPNDKDFGLTK